VAGSINERIRHFFQELAADPVEERVVEYVIREVHNGRRLMEVIEDPFVKNRLSSDKVEGILQSAEVVAALEDEIHAAFQTPDVGFTH
jgi:hypothetical protein